MIIRTIMPRTTHTIVQIIQLALEDTGNKRNRGVFPSTGSYNSKGFSCQNCFKSWGAFFKKKGNSEVP